MPGSRFIPYNETLTPGYYSCRDFTERGAIRLWNRTEELEPQADNLVTGETCPIRTASESDTLELLLNKGISDAKEIYNTLVGHEAIFKVWMVSVVQERIKNLRKALKAGGMENYIVTRQGTMGQVSRGHHGIYTAYFVFGFVDDIAPIGDYMLDRTTGAVYRDNRLAFLTGGKELIILRELTNTGFSSFSSLEKAMYDGQKPESSRYVIYNAINSLNSSFGRPLIKSIPHKGYQISG